MKLNMNGLIIGIFAIAILSLGFIGIVTEQSFADHEGLPPLLLSVQNNPLDKICPDRLYLIHKYSTGIPVCVTSDTAIKLVERNWAFYDYAKIMIFVDKSQYDIGEPVHITLFNAGNEYARFSKTNIAVIYDSQEHYVGSRPHPGLYPIGFTIAPMQFKEIVWIQDTYERYHKEGVAGLSLRLVQIESGVYHIVPTLYCSTSSPGNRNCDFSNSSQELFTISILSPEK